MASDRFGAQTRTGCSGSIVWITDNSTVFVASQGIFAKLAELLDVPANGAVLNKTIDCVCFVV